MLLGVVGRGKVFGDGMFASGARRGRRGLRRGVGHGRAASDLASLVAEMSSICGSRRPALALGVGALRCCRESWLFGCLGLRQRDLRSRLGDRFGDPRAAVSLPTPAQSSALALELERITSVLLDASSPALANPAIAPP